MMETDNWLKCYGEGWTGIITPESFCHPAKFSRALIRRIYDHAFEEGWLRPGMTVIDPFAGVGLGALEAMRRGLAWAGVELEERFVALGRQNIDLWNERYAEQMPGWGTAAILQGDSRRLGEVLRQVGACIASPPFGAAGTRDRRPYQDGDVGDMMSRAYTQDRQGISPGQLAQMPSGDHISACIASPLYLNSDTSSNGQRGIDTGDATQTARRRCKQRQATPDGYGNADGQLSQLPSGGHAEALGAEGAQCAISSPPYEGSISAGHNDDSDRQRRAERYARGEFSCKRPDVFASQSNISARGMFDPRYGDTEGQIGKETGGTFWSASRIILERVYQVLAPGGHAIWVLKSFVRKGRRVDFPGQWQELCEAVGFETIHIHRAWLVEERGAQHTLDGGLDVRKVERKGFFRRLAEKKGSPRIDWETVLCTVRP